METLDYAQLVAQIYAYFDAGNITAVIAMCTEDVDWVSFGPQDSALTGTFKGQAGAQKFFDIDAVTHNDTEFVPGTSFVQGNTVMLTGYETGTMVQSGLPMRNDWVHVWTFTGSQVSYFAQYLCNTINPPTIAAT